MTELALRLVPARRPAAAAPVLDAEQSRVVAHRGGPLLVLAGPGTGKTTTLVEHVAARVADGTPPERVLVLTFSRKAAAELRRRIALRVGHTTTSPAAMTFHAFCYAALRRFGTDGGDATEPSLRLLTAPEQDFRVREALAHGDPRWPTGLAPALPTRGFAGELRQVLARARQLGLDPDDLAQLGRDVGRPEWEAAGDFFEEYLELLDYEKALDYTELVHRTRLLLADPVTGGAIRRSYDAVVVDEYQDCDAAQIGLLRQLVGVGGEIVAVGDPDQSIYRFRGAEPRAMADFATRFAGPAGRCPVVVLRQTRRYGDRIAAAAAQVAERLPVAGGLDADAVSQLRRPEAVGPSGRVEAYLCETPGAEAAHIAHLLRRAHLVDEVPWEQMAVLVRRGRRTIPVLSRALVAAGVPVEVAGDEIPLSAELAVRPLLLAVRVVAAGCRPDAEQAVRLLLSPLGGLDSLGVRRLGRALRAAERRELAGAALPQRSDELVARALARPELLDEVPAGVADDEVAAARALASLLAQVADRVAAGAGPHEALWLLWTATPWPERLRRTAASGGEAGRRADRDLDAVCALFDVAARKETVQNRGLADLIADVESQQIPADTNREADTRGAAVRLLTAHRAKGLEWDVVVVASVQEGAWPDLRRRDGLLESTRLQRDGIAEPEPVSVALAEERRLFYVACTRARRRLVVTAVEGTEGEGDQPSRFLHDLGVPVVPLPGRPRRPLTLPGLVAELRRTAVDVEEHPDARVAAAERLAVLADARDAEGRPLAPQADPVRWWGMVEPTQARVQVVAPDEPVRLTGSSLAGLLRCPRQWFLERQVHAEQARAGAQSLGSVVHALAQYATQEGWGVDEVSARLDEVWDQLPFDAAWLSASERVEAEAALERFMSWDEHNPRELVGVEVDFEVPVRVGDDEVVLAGTVDRLERDAQGRLVVVDLKTGRRKYTGPEVLADDQLGLYQLAASLGGFDDLTGGQREVAGAELVLLRHQEGQLPWPKVMAQAALREEPAPPDDHAPAPTWVHARLGEAAAIVRSGEFAATRNDRCDHCAFRSSCPTQARGKQVLS